MPPPAAAAAAPPFATTAAAAPPTRLAVFTAADSAYLTGAVVTLVSALHHCGSGTALDLHLLHAGLTDEERDRFRDAVEPFLAGRHTLALTDLGGRLPDALPLANAYLTRLTYARLLIPALRPDLDRAVYLDSDIIVGKDLTPLVTLELGTNLLAAVQDIRRTFARSRDRDILARLGLPGPAPYLAAGFLVLNLPVWRTEGTLARCLDLAARHGEHLRQEDQTLLNIVAHRRWHALPRSWNFLVCLRRDRPRYVHHVPVNYHAILQFKPWRFERGGPCEITRLFYRHLDTTSWPRYREDPKACACRSPRPARLLHRLFKRTTGALCSLAGTLAGREILRRA